MVKPGHRAAGVKRKMLDGVSELNSIKGNTSFYISIQVSWNPEPSYNGTIKWGSC
jgi:hypothetical protein